jgi:DNA-binding PadR family transcriptional regulator
MRRPITRDIFAILVALADGEQTASEIQSQIVGDTVGLYVRNSSLYTALHRLEEMGLVRLRGKWYALTEAGWHWLRVETRTFEELVTQAKGRIIRGGYGRW